MISFSRRKLSVNGRVTLHQLQNKRRTVFLLQKNTLEKVQTWVGVREPSDDIELLVEIFVRCGLSLMRFSAIFLNESNMLLVAFSGLPPVRLHHESRVIRSRSLYRSVRYASRVLSWEKNRHRIWRFPRVQVITWRYVGMDHASLWDGLSHGDFKLCNIK